jgi:hypothetical protein
VVIGTVALSDPPTCSASSARPGALRRAVRCPVCYGFQDVQELLLLALGHREDVLGLNATVPNLCCCGSLDGG